MPPIVEDWKWVVLTIAQEASSEPIDGKIAVAEVIRERMENKYNSDGTLVGTVLSPYQFSGWNSGDRNRIRVAQMDMTHPSMVDCIKAYEEAFQKRTNLARGANLYHADWMVPFPEWTKSPKVTRLVSIGRHIFYKEER